MIFLVSSLSFHSGQEKLYSNPVLNDNRPDPAALKLPSGSFVAVSTSGKQVKQ